MTSTGASTTRAPSATWRCRRAGPMRQRCRPRCGRRRRRCALRSAGARAVVFLAPLGAHHAIAFEAWQAVGQWAVVTDAAGVVQAVRDVFGQQVALGFDLANLAFPGFPNSDDIKLFMGEVIPHFA